MKLINRDKIRLQQKRLCEKYGAQFVECPLDLKVGVAFSLRAGELPFNGLRHPMTTETCGWFLWGGETLSNDIDFFQPLHANHLSEWRPEILVYLGLAPGWRFLTDGSYVDVWFDESLLKITN